MKEALERKKALNGAIKQASQFLANTPTVCKSSYVHPDVQEAYAAKAEDLAPFFSGSPRGGPDRGETALLCIIEHKHGK